MMGGLILYLSWHPASPFNLHQTTTSDTSAPSSSSINGSVGPVGPQGPRNIKITPSHNIDADNNIDASVRYPDKDINQDSYIILA